MKIFTSKSSSLIVTIEKNIAKTCGAISHSSNGTKQNITNFMNTAYQSVPKNVTTASYATLWI